MKKLLVVLTCGHHIEDEVPSRRGNGLPYFLEAKLKHWDVNCFQGGDTAGHESYVAKLLTSNVDRLWIEEA